MSTFARIAELPLRVDSYALDGLRRHVSSGFVRATTVVRLRGDGAEGLGEDVAYDEEDHLAFQAAGAHLPLAGRYTLAEFSRQLEELELFRKEPLQPSARFYRRWAFESAALDLALLQAGRSLAETLGRRLEPLSFVVSLRLGEPPSIEPLSRLLELYPALRFKLDPTSSWDEALIARLVAAECVDSVDFKGAYRGTPVDQAADAALYRRVVEAFPEVWIEDPALTAETEAVLRPHRDRVTWDAVIHSVEDIRDLPFPARMVNIKPSRFGSLRRLFETYDDCHERGIGMYGGGQFELGPGRGQIQYLASLFHPNTPNDVAPGGYNEPVPRAGLPVSPLTPQPAPTGFRWG